MRDILGTLRRAKATTCAGPRARRDSLARSLPFDAAIVDIMMPANGIETLDELKRIDEDRN